jgi:hypothetical protein
MSEMILNENIPKVRPAFMLEHHRRCMNASADQNQILAWDHSFDILQKELKQTCPDQTGNCRIFSP